MFRLFFIFFFFNRLFFIPLRQFRDDKNVRDAALLPIMDKIAEEYPDLTEAEWNRK